MSKAARNILTLNHDEAMDFFMKSEQYHGFELPEYFSFDEVLKYVREKVRTIPYEECLKKGVSPDSLSDVNLDILLNKDGRYAVRPIILANPFLYYFLVREVCCESNWQVIKDLFEKFNVPHITSCAIPVIPNEKEPFHKSTTILNWWNSMEQRSLELSLEYRYMFVSDITNCYGSVNPQSIEWALNMKGTSHETNSNSQIAVNTQKYLRAFQHGRNIGIPQGSAIFDFVGELVLGYSDLLLHEAIQKEKRKHKITGSYEIIRYRDDYRIFCNDKDELETISYILQQVLESLNFRMNSQKTKISDSIVTDAIKHDKLAYIYNTPIFNKKGVDFDSFEKHLLFVLLFGRENPNSGQLKTLLSDIDKRIEEWLKPYEEEVETISILDETPKVTKKTVTKQRRLVGGSVRAMSAVCAQIAIENVSVSHYALRVLSRMVDSLKDNKEKWDIINKVYSKLVNQPNSSYNQLWLQNITYQQDVKEKISPYDMRLCKLVMGEEVQLWNNQWLKDELGSSFPILSVVNSELLAKAMDAHVITFRETRAYAEAIDEDDFEIDVNNILVESY